MASTITDSLRKNSGVLILGASGRLGQMLATFWPDRTELSLHSRQPKAGFIQFDLILEPEKAVAAMRGKAAVICLPGVTPATAGQDSDGYSRNTDLACAALRAATTAGVDRVFLASSAAVYGATGGLHRETDPLHPVAPYGQSKRDMEQTAQREIHPGSPALCILRIGNVAGADAILGGWRAGMQLDQLPDQSTPRRSYIGPVTLAHVLARLCTRPDLPEVLNIAAPAVIAMGDLLDAAQKPWQPRPAPAGVIKEVALCTKRLERLVPFSPEDSSATGMVQQWQQFRERQAK